MSLIARDALQQISSLVLPVEQLAADDDLFAAGLSSFDLVNLIVCLEASLGIEFPAEAMSREHFTTMASIERTIASLANKDVTHD